MTKTNKSRQKKRAFISIFLIVAILIGGAFAFLTAQDSKTNVFTIGNIKIELWENFDANLDGTTEEYNATHKTVTATGNIVPGTTVKKEPFVKNTSDNPCHLYMTVKVPNLTKAEAFVQNEGDAFTLDGEKKIEVTAYAIQDGYADKTDAKEIWESYFEKNVKSFGEEDTAGDKVQMFKIKGIDETLWELVKSAQAVKENNEYKNVYTYVYKGTQNTEGVYDYLLQGKNDSPALFTEVELDARIGGLETTTNAVNGAVIETVSVTASGVKRGYIYGLRANLSEEALTSSITGDNVTFEVTRSGGRFYGTDSKVKVYSKVTGDLIEEYTVIVFGDVSQDGVINSVDTTLLANHLRDQNAYPLSEGQMKAAKIVSGNIAGGPTLEDHDTLQAIIMKTVALEIDQTTGTCKPTT